MTEFGRILVMLGPTVPLALAPLALAITRPSRLLAWAAVPGLLAALFAPCGELIFIPGILLGVGLRLDPVGRLFLGCASFLWICAGIYAAAYLGGKARERSFCIFWCLTLAGSLGAFVAADVAMFYTSFAFLSLAAYVLVVHDRTDAARRAGRIYIVLGVFGEICLLLGLMLASASAGSLWIDDMRAVLAASPWRDFATLGLVIGFGLKAGLIPLHVWLPLAHSAAPVPASAVLSGAIVKAGIIGLIRFLPMEDALPSWAGILTWLGVATAYYGVLLGLSQRHPKAVLAYSTLSQMGIVVAVLGVGLAGTETGTVQAASFYAAHHGLAKGALFLSVGVAAASDARNARPVIAVAALLGAAVAGLPFTGGALAKLAIKEPIGDGIAAMLVAISAIGTMLLMLRFVALLAGQELPEKKTAPSPGLVISFAATTVAALVVPWILFPRVTGLALRDALAPANIWTLLWPLLLVFIIALGVWRSRISAPVVPVGDIVDCMEARLRRLVRPTLRPQSALPTLKHRTQKWICTFGIGPMLSLRLRVSSERTRRAVSAKTGSPCLHDVLGAPLPAFSGEGLKKRAGTWVVSGTALLIVSILLGLTLWA